MKLIVGLGNVGREYLTTRHNVGVMVVGELARRHRVRVAQAYRHGRRTLARYGDWAVRRVTVRLMLPQTMMNRSGEAMTAMSAWHVAAEEALVICDDVNLPLGVLRLRPEGSAGGHKGLASCLEELRTEQLPRLRVGIGTHALPEDLTTFVLTPFAGEERPRIREAITRAVEACELWATEGVQVAMNRVNPKPQR